MRLKKQGDRFVSEGGSVILSQDALVVQIQGKRFALRLPAKSPQTTVEVVRNSRKVRLPV